MYCTSDPVYEMHYHNCFSGETYHKWVFGVRRQSADSVAQLRSWVNDFPVHKDIVSRDPPQGYLGGLPGNMQLVTAQHLYMGLWGGMCTFNKMIQIEINQQKSNSAMSYPKKHIAPIDNVLTISII